MIRYEAEVQCGCPNICYRHKSWGGLVPERHCKAMVLLTSGRWTRCGRRPVELHHRLTRARGGTILDAVGETYHLMDLCPWHHKVAHDEGQAFESGLLIDGSVTSGPHGPVYVGSDRYLLNLYG